MIQGTANSLIKIKIKIYWAVLKSLFIKTDPYAKINIYAKKFQKRLLSLPRQGTGPREFASYVINLETSKTRLKNFLKYTDRYGLTFERIEAVDCRNQNFSFAPFRHLIGERFYDSEMFPRGSIGCFLSHRKAWLQLLASPFDWALICEDDAEAFGPMPKTIREFGFPADADLVYVNQRMAEPFLTKAHFAENRGRQFSCYPVFDVMRERFETNLGFDVVGAESYFLSKRGAQQLLNAYGTIGYKIHNDLFMLLHALTPPERSRVDKAVGHPLLVPLKAIPEKILHGYVILPPLFGLMKTKSSISMNDAVMKIRRKEIDRL